MLRVRRIFGKKNKEGISTAYRLGITFITISIFQ